MTITFLLIAWGIAGVFNMLSDDISKFNYFLCWAALMIELIYRNYVEGR